MADVHERCKARVAALTGLPASDIGFFLNSSDALSTAMAALDLQGGNVVVARGDFNSLALNAELAVRRAGAALNYAGDGMVFDEDDIAAATDADTRAIAVSHVSHLTGRRCDLARLREIADASGARLIVDCAHSLGAMPIDGAMADVLVSCTYKWQLGVHGSAVFAVNSARWPDAAARTIGWHAVEPVDHWRNSEVFDVRSDAARFEAGNPPYMALYVLDNGLAHLQQLSPATRAAHILALSSGMRHVLTDLGVDVLTPGDAAARAGNIAFAVDDPMAVVAALRAQGIFVWGGEGRVRFSAHVYNDANDLLALSEALAGINPALLRQD
ncbi:MAG: aminotransferase class V-fold PLP-dependent enzyme [Alphaproteobacteria bacterium]|nr:aminotransferase class V-fold PLP-dependent enzyme [Alphaproteobacteria bacterium]